MKKLPLLYARNSNGSVQQWHMIVDGDSYYSVEGLVDGKQTQNSPTIAKIKNADKANATTVEEQALKEATAKWQKKLDKGYYQDISQIDKPKFVECMLCKSYGDYKEKIKFPVFSQEKLDGLRLIVTKNSMTSRNGKPYTSIPHIAEALKPVFEEFPDLIFDGECYSDKLKNDFEVICSIARKQKPSKEELEISRQSIFYHVYDLVDTQTKFSKRFERLKSIVNNLNSPHIKLVETLLVEDVETLDKLYETYVANGVEGQIIRLDEPYEQKRSKVILKRKEFQDAEFPILSVTEGEGNKAGMTASMLIDLGGGKTCNSNVKGSFGYLRELWAKRESLVGKMATVQYFNKTSDGSLRFPYVIKIDRESYE